CTCTPVIHTPSLHDALPIFGRLESLTEETLAEAARLLELLLVDVLDELDVVLVHLRLLVEQTVENPVDVLRQGALLRAARLGEGSEEHTYELQSLALIACSP